MAREAALVDKGLPQGPPQGEKEAQARSVAFHTLNAFCSPFRGRSGETE